jgi:hypothetical protein
MAAIGINEAAEGVTYFASGPTSVGDRAQNVLRDAARDVAVHAGGSASTGEAAYYGVALISNVGAAVASVTRVLPFSRGWLTTQQPRLDTLGNTRANILGGTMMTNGYHMVNPQE